MQSRVLSQATSLKEECTDAYGLLRALLTDRGTDDGSVASEATAQALLRCQGINHPQLWSKLADEGMRQG